MDKEKIGTALSKARAIINLAIVNEPSSKRLALERVIRLLDEATVELSKSITDLDVEINLDA